MSELLNIPPPDARTVEGWWEREKAIRQVAVTRRADFLLRYFRLPIATGVEDARYQRFQFDMFNFVGMLRSINKSRQIGASFSVAGDALGAGLMTSNSNVISVSFNQEEANEKVVYASRWWDSRAEQPWLIPTRDEFDDNGNWQGISPTRLLRWPDLVTDNAYLKAWSNGFRFISHPCRPPRGKKSSVILDELAHYQNAAVIYQAAFWMITRGRGTATITILSTPLGAGDTFWEIHTDPTKYPDYVRFDYGWWENDELCKDRVACDAAWRAGASDEELVERFGTQQLLLLCRNALWEDFLQEMCLKFLEGTYAFLPWELIRSCYPSARDDLDQDPEDDDEFDAMLAQAYEGRYFYVRARTRTPEGASEDESLIEKALDAINDLVAAIEDSRMGGVLVLGYDVGRTHDASEISIWEVWQGRFLQRAMITLPQCPFKLQKLVLNYAFERLPIVRGRIDKGGLGMDLAETMERRWGDRAEGVTFTNDRKNRWAVDMKTAMQRHQVILIPDREQEQQLHSIQRKATSSKVFTYEVDDSHAMITGGQKIKHHADKFWACALAIYVAIEVASRGRQGKPIMPTDSPRANVDTKVKLHQKGFRLPASSARRAQETVTKKMRRAGD